MAMAAGATVFMLSGPTTHQVPVGASLQAVINIAEPGDTIVVQAGGAYVGTITLPVKSGEGVITIQSSRAAELPAGQRVGPAQAPLFAKLQSAVNGEQVIKTVAGAKGYKFVGVEISTTTASVAVFDLVRWGEDRRTQTTPLSVPSNLSIDRSYIHGWPTQNVQRGVAMNCANCEVTNSYVSDIHWIGQDSQAICGWNGAKGQRIINNYLEAAGENLMIGGADSATAEMMPANIEIKNNYLFKPLSWKVGHPTYAGIHWTIKNLLEIKAGRNVTIDGNLIENSWGDAQIGYAVLFTVRNQDGNALWSVIENVTFTNNIVKNAEQGFQLLGMDNLKPSGQSSGLLMRNNLITGITNRFFTINGYHNVTLDHNTHFQGGNIMILMGAPSNGFAYTNNVTNRLPYGIFGDGVGEGNAAIAKYIPAAKIAGNVIAGADARFYPTNNFFPVNLDGLATFKGTDGLTPGYSASLATPTPSATPSPSVSLPSPTATATATPTGTPTPAPLPSPSPTPTSTPAPTPTPSPQPLPSLPKCAVNQIIGNPAKCLCTTGVRCTGNNARCL